MPPTIPPLLLTSLLFGLMWLISYTLPQLIITLPYTEGIAMVISAIGLTILVTSSALFRLARTTVNPLTPHKTSTLIAHSIYRYSRNPMYVSFALLLTAWAVFLSHALVVLVPPTFVIYIDRFQIPREEAALAKNFGEAFEAYKAKVRRWI